MRTRSCRCAASGPRCRWHTVGRERFVRLVRGKLQRTGKIARLSFARFCLFVCLRCLRCLPGLAFCLVLRTFPWRTLRAAPLVAVPPLFPMLYRIRAPTLHSGDSMEASYIRLMRSTTTTTTQSRNKNLITYVMICS